MVRATAVIVPTNNGNQSCEWTFNERGGDDGHFMAEMVRWFACQRDHLLEIGKDEYINTWLSGPGGSPLPGFFFVGGPAGGRTGRFPAIKQCMVCGPPEIVDPAHPTRLQGRSVS